MREINANSTFRGQHSALSRTVTAHPSTSDSGKVRMGGHAPALPQVRATAAAVADSGTVRLGGHAPALPPVRALSLIHI